MAIKWPKMAKNDPKWQKMTQNDPKITFLKCRDLRVLPGTNFLLTGTLNYSAPLPVALPFSICNLPVLPRLRMCDQTGSPTICVLPLHIAIPTPELLLVNIMCSVSHQIPIGVLLSQPPCVPVNWLLGTLTRHFPTSEIKIFLSNAQVRRQSLLSNAYTFNNNHKLWFTTQAVHGTLLLFLIWILYFLCIGLF